jgi:hypothetical protein
MPVGDVNSQERGAGARYNDGKVPLELIPAWILAKATTPEPRPAYQGREHEARYFIALLGRWQQGECGAVSIIKQCSLESVREAARVFGYGAKKYAAWNWIKGMPWSVPLGCALRHAFAIIEGEELDPESGLPHRGHLVCNLIMLAQFERTYPEGDDRPVKWLSTEDKAPVTGGPSSPEAGGPAPEKSTEIERPQCFDPSYRHEATVPSVFEQLEAWRASRTRSTPTLPPGKHSGASAGHSRS